MWFLLETPLIFREKCIFAASVLVLSCYLKTQHSLTHCHIAWTISLESSLVHKKYAFVCDSCLCMCVRVFVCVWYVCVCFVCVWCVCACVVCVCVCGVCVCVCVWLTYLCACCICVSVYCLCLRVISVILLIWACVFLVYLCLCTLLLLICTCHSWYVMRLAFVNVVIFVRLLLCGCVCVPLFVHVSLCIVCACVPACLQFSV